MASTGYDPYHQTSEADLEDGLSVSENAPTEDPSWDRVAIHPRPFSAPELTNLYGTPSMSTYKGTSLMRKRRPLEDPTVGICVGPYGDPRGGAISDERGIPVIVGQPPWGGPCVPYDAGPTEGALVKRENLHRTYDVGP